MFEIKGNRLAEGAYVGFAELSKLAEIDMQKEH